MWAGGVRTTTDRYTEEEREAHSDRMGSGAVLQCAEQQKDLCGLQQSEQEGRPTPLSESETQGRCSGSVAVVVDGRRWLEMMSALNSSE